MTGIELMHQIQKTNRKIRQLEEQIERATHKATGVTAIRYDIERVQNSLVGDKLTDIVNNIIETTEKLKAEIIKLQELENEALEYLIQLPEQYERVLSYHYLDNMSWEAVSVRMNYESHYVYEVKKKALKQLTEIIKQDGK